jgi:hypothetical protein
MLPIYTSKKLNIYYYILLYILLYNNIYNMGNSISKNNFVSSVMLINNENYEEYIEYYKDFIVEYSQKSLKDCSDFMSQQNIINSVFAIRNKSTVPKHMANWMDLLLTIEKYLTHNFYKFYVNDNLHKIYKNFDNVNETNFDFDYALLYAVNKIIDYHNNYPINPSVSIFVNTIKKKIIFLKIDKKSKHLLCVWLILLNKINYFSNDIDFIKNMEIFLNISYILTYFEQYYFDSKNYRPYRLYINQNLYDNGKLWINYFEKIIDCQYFSLYSTHYNFLEYLMVYSRNYCTIPNNFVTILYKLNLKGIPIEHFCNHNIGSILCKYLNVIEQEYVESTKNSLEHFLVVSNYNENFYNNYIIEAINYRSNYIDVSSLANLYKKKQLVPNKEIQATYNNENKDKDNIVKIKCPFCRVINHIIIEKNIVVGLNLDCSICYMNKDKFVFLPCGHLSSCLDCSKKIIE